MFLTLYYLYLLAIPELRLLLHQMFSAVMSDTDGESRWTHVFQAAHEVVADRRSGQIRRVRASTDIEEVIGSQHGVILLRVTGGGQNTIHRYSDLKVGAREKERDRERFSRGETEREEKGEKETGLRSHCGCAGSYSECL